MRSLAGTATRVWLELFSDAGDKTPSRVIEPDPDVHRTGDVWHVWVEGIRPGQLYGYRIDGPYLPREGHRYNANKLLLDPLACAITYLANWDFGSALGYDPSSAQRDLAYSMLEDAQAMPKCIYTHEHFDWEKVRPPRRSWSETVIYEVHVRGFTIHPSSGVDHPGSYRGLVEKVAYLKGLGVTAVELMPVFEFNENEQKRVNPLTGAELRNYWGYSPVTFLAPKASYCSSGFGGQQKLEFKEMIKALHRAGIEVILDIVLNHTAEGSELGPTLSFRGLDNAIFYMLEQRDRRFYKDYTGTGNTLNANHPVVRDFILDVLRYWAMEVHVDGFRFDLASVLGRDVHGNLLANAPLLERIAEDPILREVELIAEAWDAGGAYQVGSFSERRWAEWNRRYRGEVRRFWRGDGGMMGLFASRISGSADLYQGSGKGPESSINLVTCHDGFTMNDLVSYRYKHNEANGEKNCDGMDENYSENYGIEGVTDDPEVAALRKRQIKNLALTLLISRGVPMIVGGDEFRRTQRGNNNAYCQDNETSWYDWRCLDEHQEIYRFVRGMVAFRRFHSVLRREAFYTEADIHWYSPAGETPNWSDPGEMCLACMAVGDAGADLFLMFNASPQWVTFVLPSRPSDQSWHRAVDTFQPTPGDLLEIGEEIPLNNQMMYHVGPRASAILVAHA